MGLFAAQYVLPDYHNGVMARVMVLAREVGRCEIVEGIGEGELRAGIAAALAFFLAGATCSRVASTAKAKPKSATA